MTTDKPLQKGFAVVWGVREQKPIVNIPPDALRVKIRMRDNQAARAFVRFKDRIERWIICPEGKQFLNSANWELGALESVNAWQP